MYVRIIQVPIRVINLRSASAPHIQRARASIPLSQLCVLHIYPYFQNNYKSPPISAKLINSRIFVQRAFFGLVHVFPFPLYFEHGALINNAVV